MRSFSGLDYSAMKGIWRSRGYGSLATCDDEGILFQDLTALSLIPVERLRWDEAERALEFVDSASPNHMSFKNAHDVTVYQFDRLVDGGVTRPIGAGDLDAARNFDVFCAYLLENYAFNTLRGVDWREVQARYRPKILAAPDENRLAEVFAEIIFALKDAHTSVARPGQFIAPGSLIADRKVDVERAFGAPAWVTHRAAYTRIVQSAFGDMFLGGRYRVLCNHMMICGEIEPGIGYLSIFGEFGFGANDTARRALDLPRRRTDSAAFLRAEIEGMNAGLDEAAEALSGVRALIVDTRLNYGGYDRLALEFAGRFSDQRRLAYRKKAWTPNGFTAAQDINFEPRQPSFAHLPVYMLTGRQTASAGEILVLAMRACPNVTIVGEDTLGILSDNLYKRLPNGWELSLSNEVYEAGDGGLYEARGVPPDVACIVHDPLDVRGGLNVAVETAIAAARRDIGA